MQPIRNAWCIQIDITNYCFLSCLYCSRYNRHLRKDQRRHMSLEQIEKALDSLKTWPARIGIIGGEPLLHPDFSEICELIRGKFPPSKMGLWTSGGKKFNELTSLISKTFGVVAYNEHNKEQLQVCKHQPLTIAIKDAVPDECLRKTLIDDCWVQRTWCATINHFGAYFCEVAAAQDVLLNEGKNAWPVEPGWWKKEPEEFQDQVDKFCDNCGMAIPMERELIQKKTEKFSPSVLRMFRERNLTKVSDADIELFKYQFSKEEIKKYAKVWAPGNYRGDLSEDETACEGLGFTKEIT
jgi:organic radical activating enzyme